AVLAGGYLRVGGSHNRSGHGQVTRLRLRRDGLGHRGTEGDRRPERPRAAGPDDQRERGARPRRRWRWRPSPRRGGGRGGPGGAGPRRRWRWRPSPRRWWWRWLRRPQPLLEPSSGGARPAGRARAFRVVRP